MSSLEPDESRVHTFAHTTKLEIAQGQPGWLQVQGKVTSHIPNQHQQVWFLSSAPNAQGYAVGNGCTDERIDGNALPLFGVGKSLLPYSEYVEMQESCKGEFWNRTEGESFVELWFTLWVSQKW